MIYAKHLLSNSRRKEDVEIHTILFFPCTTDEHASINEKRCGTQSTVRKLLKMA